MLTVGKDKEKVILVVVQNTDKDDVEWFAKKERLWVMAQRRKRLLIVMDGHGDHHRGHER